MGLTTTVSILLMAYLVSSIECFSTYRHQPTYDNKPETITSSCEEIKTLLNLARILDDQEKSKVNNYNPEDMIMKLVNALVITATNKCSDNNYRNTGNQHSRGSRDGLFNADFFDPNNPNNVAQFDVGKQTIAGFGVGDTTNGIIAGAAKAIA